MIGFVIEGFEFDVYVSSGSSLSMDQAVLEIIGSLNFIHADHNLCYMH